MQTEGTTVGRWCDGSTWRGRDDGLLWRGRADGPLWRGRADEPLWRVLPFRSINARAVISSHLLEPSRTEKCHVSDSIVSIKHQVAYFSLVSNIDQYMHSPVSIFCPIRNYFHKELEETIRTRYLSPSSSFLPLLYIFVLSPSLVPP